MEQYEFRKKSNLRLNQLQKLLNEGIQIGIDLQELLKKVDSIKRSLDDGIIRIVLLGSFSDGKTSAIAGLLGRLEDTMKIDIDESSDELKVYRPAGLKQGFEIVDTPGLFGTKEKEVDGKTVKFSEITEKYISEAHILLYVCDAVTPLKESHTEIIRRIMREYKKLDSTIFVINKMDETGCDLLDDVDFRQMEGIKKENLISRLRSTINLTPDEERRLNIVCISADPKGKGLQHWFAKADDYLRRSHINTLRACLDKVVEQSDSKELQKSASDVSIRDIVNNACNEITEGVEPIKVTLVKQNEQIQDLEFDSNQMKTELATKKNDMGAQLNQLKSNLVMDIKSASLDTIGDVIDSQIGVQDGKITFYVFNQKVNAILSTCGDANTDMLKTASIKFEKTFSMQEEMLTEATKFGGKYLKNVNISGEQVKAARDFISQYFGKTYKFKPWGAINLGKNLTKWAGWVGAGIGVGLELYDWYKRHKAAKELAELKDALCNGVNNMLAQIFDLFNNDSTYYKNFAPAYIDLCNRLKERQQEIENLQQKITNLEAYNNRLRQWLTAEAEEVEYKEVKS